MSRAVVPQCDFTDCENPVTHADPGSLCCAHFMEFHHWQEENMKRMGLPK